MNAERKFFEKGWFAGLTLFAFFPLGVFLLWKYHHKHKILNAILTVIFGFPFLIVTIAIFMPSESFEDGVNKKTEQVEQTSQLKVEKDVNQSSIEPPTSEKEEAETQPILEDTHQVASLSDEVDSNVNSDAPVEVQKTQTDNKETSSAPMYNDREFTSFNFGVDVPDFFSFTSYEQRQFNQNERYDRIDETESGLVYSYQNYDLTSDGLDQYATLLEKLNFIEENDEYKDPFTRKWSKDNVKVSVTINFPVRPLSNFEYASVSIFYDFPSDPNEYDDDSAIEGDYIRYANDGFVLYMPSNTQISSIVKKESVDQFSMSSGKEVPIEKEYEMTVYFPFNYIQLYIFEDNSFVFDENNRITIPNADRAYLSKKVSDSIAERSSYELVVTRGNLIYILSAKYDPTFTLMSGERGQTDFSEDRELTKGFLDTVEKMITNFALTDEPVDFDTICSTELRATRASDLVH